MKRWGFALLAGALVLPGGARAVSVGAGIFAGPSIPVIQDDTGTGVQFGLRLPIHVIPALTIEPFYARSNLGDHDQSSWVSHDVGNARAHIGCGARRISSTLVAPSSTEPNTCSRSQLDSPDVASPLRKRMRSPLHTNGV